MPTPGCQPASTGNGGRGGIQTTGSASNGVPGVGAFNGQSHMNGGADTVWTGGRLPPAPLENIPCRPFGCTARFVYTPQNSAIPAVVVTARSS